MFAYAVWFLCVYSLGNVNPVDSTHFMGGIIRWRPVNPAAFDGTVRIVALSSSHDAIFIMHAIHGHACMHTYS